VSAGRCRCSGEERYEVVQWRAVVVRQERWQCEKGGSSVRQVQQVAGAVRRAEAAVSSRCGRAAVLWW